MKLTKEQRKAIKKQAKEQKKFRIKFLTLSRNPENQEKEKLEKVIKLGKLIKLDWKIVWANFHAKTKKN